MDTGDTVTDVQHGTDFAHLCFGAEIGDLVLMTFEISAALISIIQPFIALSPVIREQSLECADRGGELRGRRPCASTPRKFLREGIKAHFLSTAAIAFAAASRPMTGLVVSARSSADCC